MIFPLQYNHFSILEECIIPHDMDQEFSDLKKALSRRTSDSVKWNRYPEDVLPLWVADMDFPSPEEIIEGIRARLGHPFFGYSKKNTELTEKICSWLKRRHGWEVQPDQIVLVPGVVVGLNWTIQSILSAGESFIFQTPVYPPFFEISSNSSTRGIISPLIRGCHQYEIDFNDLEKRIQVDTRVFLLCNPHNPVGRVFSKDELEKIGEICEKFDLILCSDEIHCDLIFPENKHVPIASISRELAQRTVTLMAPSKTFNIAGLHCAFAVVQNDELRKRMDNSRRGLVGVPNLLAEVAASIAFSKADQWLDRLINALQQNRAFLTDFIRTSLPEIQMFPPEGTYLAWMDCSKLELFPDTYEFFMKKAKVAVNRGLDFGEEARDFIRLNFACPQQLLRDALERIMSAVNYKS